jgi:hypothetical protein
VQNGPSHSQGFDTDTVLTTTSAPGLVAAGYCFCIRYLSLQSPGKAGDLTLSEAGIILAAKLGLMAVQYVDAYGWTPTAALGTTHGTAAAANAVAAGLPIATTVWLDLEGVASGTSASAVSGYANAWFTAVAAAGFLAGIYIGADSGFTTSDQLYQDLSTQHYWSSASSVPAVATRGYQMVQSLGSTVGGVAIDADKTQTDEDGGQVAWLVSTPVVLAS